MSRFVNQHLPKYFFDLCEDMTMTSIMNSFVVCVLITTAIQFLWAKKYPQFRWQALFTLLAYSPWWELHVLDGWHTRDPGMGGLIIAAHMLIIFWYVLIRSVVILSAAYTLPENGSDIVTADSKGIFITPLSALPALSFCLPIEADLFFLNIIALPAAILLCILRRFVVKFRSPTASAHRPDDR